MVIDNEDVRHRMIISAIGKYTSLAEVLRPWTVFSTIMDCCSPGVGRYLHSHTLELFRLFGEISKGPNKLPSLVNFRLHIVDQRLRNPAFDPRGWLSPDEGAITQYITNYQPATLPRMSIPDVPEPPRPNLPWRVDSIGSLTSSQACELYNAHEDCPGPLCHYRHKCLSCNGDLHPWFLCDEVKAFAGEGESADSQRS